MVRFGSGFYFPGERAYAAMEKAERKEKKKKKVDEVSEVVILNKDTDLEVVKCHFCEKEESHPRWWVKKNSHADYFSPLSIYVCSDCVPYEIALQKEYERRYRARLDSIYAGGKCPCCSGVISRGVELKEFSLKVNMGEWIYSNHPKYKK